MPHRRAPAVLAAVLAVTTAFAEEPPAGAPPAGLAEAPAAPVPSGEAQAPGAQPPAAGAQPPAAAPATQAEVKALAEEVRRLKLEIGIPDIEYKSWAGLGPAASKVYYQPKGLAIGGYGEVVYSRYLDAGDAQSDLLRAVVYVGYRFSEHILFNSEIEFEHANQEAGVEFAYLDFVFAPEVRLRAGNLLVPVGIVNEMHEPAFFHGVFRPGVEVNLIPTTWHDNGLGLYGEAWGLRYKAYLLTGLRVLGAEPLSAATWLRNARTDGSESPSGDLALALALSYDLGPAAVGASAYRGRAGQGATAPTGERIRADVLIAEVHATLAWKGLQVRGLYALGTLGDAGPISAALGLSGASVIGSRVRGGYLEVAYDLLSALAPGSEHSLFPFLRLEAMNLHDEVPAGGIKDPALDTVTWTGGLTYKPLPNVVAKADYQRTTSQAAGAPAAEQFDLGVGYVF